MTEQEKLELDLQALGRLSADLRDMSGELTSATTPPARGPAGADIPSMTAALGLLDEVMPGLRGMVGERLDEFAGSVDLARNNFSNVNDDRGAVLSAKGNLQTRPHDVLLNLFGPTLGLDY